MKARFKEGDRVILSEAGRENDCYAKFRDQTLVITHVATAYMPAKEFFARGRPKGFHPGFDASANCALYDCEGINCSLYGWELIRK